MTAVGDERFDPDENATIAALKARIIDLEFAVTRDTRLAKFNLFLKNVNAALVDLPDPADALARICQRAIVDAGLALAWVGSKDDRLHRVVPTCVCGPNASYIDEIIVTTDLDLPTSRGPTVLCMLEKRTVYIDDFQTDPIMQPWWTLGAKYNFGSCASFPLVVRGKSRQVVSLYSEQPGYFDANVRAVLDECAERISLTLAALEAERELAARNRLLRDMSAMAVIGAWEMDPRTRKITGSFEAAAILGLDQADEFIDRDILRMFLESDAAMLRQSLAEAVEVGAPFDVELKTRTATDEEKWLRIIGAADIDEGKVTRVLGAVQDITSSKQALAVLAESEERYRSLMMAMAEGVVLQDEDTAIIAFNDSATRILGLSPDQLKGRTSYDPTWRAIREDGSHFAGDTHPVPKTLRTGVPQSNVVMGIHKVDDTLAWVSINAQPLFRTGESKPYRAVATLVDITAQRRIEAELVRAARYDSLTGLLNRAGFIDAVNTAVVETPCGSQLTAVALLNLDHFKDVNDTLGQVAGDMLLKALSARLLSFQPPSRIVGRLGGDEFALLLRGMTSQSEIDRIAQGVLKTISEPVDLDGVAVRLGVSLGVAVNDDEVVDTETLLSRANLALNRAKDQGRGVVRYFTKAMDEAARRRVTLGRQLHAAIHDGQFRLLYQPQVEAVSGAIIGAEALLRWDNPTRGVVGPSEFIPIAESLGLAAAIGRWVIDNACKQIRQWLDDGLYPPPVAINLSATHFTRAGELERDLDVALALYRVAPSQLELELTETVLMESVTEHSDTLMRLRARGFSLSIDDFGTGYSSLDYLRRFPADRIKIDQNFVKDIDSTPGNMAIVKAVIGLARQLGMAVIAEGVETQAHRDLLRAWDCAEMQGYFFSHPVDAEAFAVFLATGQRLPA